MPQHFSTRIRVARLCALFLTVMTIFMLVVLPSFASTKIVHRWVLTGVPMPRLKKILVRDVVENYLIRQHFEDEMERLLAKAGIESFKSHSCKV